MVQFHTSIVLLVATTIGIALSQAGPTLGEDFRVDNAVYVGDQKEPSSQSMTIFHDGMVYDFLTTPAETVVFDQTAGRFVLLNVARRTRTELTTAAVTTFLGQLRLAAAKSKDPVVKFLAEPKFQEHADDKASELTLSSPLVSYRLTLSPEPSQSVVEQYHDFCDWYARLNALLAPGSQPPFGRLVVNAALAQRHATASQVALTITSMKESKQQRSTVRSEHRVVRPLQPADLQRVAQTRELMGSYKLVAFDQYRKITVR